MNIIIKNLIGNNIRFKKYRLFYSKEFNNKNFLKKKKQFNNNDDIVNERNLIEGCLIQTNEIIFTQFIIFLFLFLIILLFSLISIFFIQSLLIKFLILTSSFVFYILSRKKRETLIMNNMGIDLSNDFFNYKIINDKNM